MSLKSDKAGPSRKRKRRSENKAAAKSSNKNVHDLMLPLPKESPSIGSRTLLKRLEDTSFTHAALTHIVFGIPRKGQDEAETAIPIPKITTGGKIEVLRRFHAVLESLSDLSHYTKRSSNSDAGTLQSARILQDYDLVSIAPRNEAIFQSACQSATGADIIVLDYTAGRSSVQLPYKIRSADVKAVVARNGVFEIPYAPALLNRNQRKGLIQTW